MQQASNYQTGNVLVFGYFWVEYNAMDILIFSMKMSFILTEVCIEVFCSLAGFSKRNIRGDHGCFYGKNQQNSTMPSAPYSCFRVLNK